MTSEISELTEYMPKTFHFSEQTALEAPCGVPVRHEETRGWIRNMFVAAIVASFHARKKKITSVQRTSTRLTAPLTSSWALTHSAWRAPPETAAQRLAPHPSSTSTQPTFTKARLISLFTSLLQTRLYFCSGKPGSNRAVQTDLPKAVLAGVIRREHWSLYLGAHTKLSTPCIAQRRLWCRAPADPRHLLTW